jgi:hypothetical protein
VWRILGSGLGSRPNRTETRSIGLDQGDSKINRERERDHRPVGQRTPHPALTLPFASLSSSFSSHPPFHLLLVFPSPSRSFSQQRADLFSFSRAALSAPSRSRNPIRYPIFRIIPSPPRHIASRDRSVVVRQQLSITSAELAFLNLIGHRIVGHHCHPYVIPRSLFSFL